MNKENYFIKQFSNSKFIGDDGAVVGKWVYSNDAFFENVHFKKEWMSLKQIAKKAMLVNISDAISMNAKPKYALLSVAIPSSYDYNDLKKLASGFKKIAKKYKIKIIGGDTISNSKLDISITIISKTKKPIYRNGAKDGDFVCYTGELGSCKKDLQKLLNSEKISKKSKFIKPKLRGEFFYKASKYINSALDVSDGLFFECERLSLQSKIGFDFFTKISEEVGTSGEEYEILFTFEKKNKKKIERIARKSNIALNIFAKAVKGKSYINNFKGHHFE